MPVMERTEAVLPPEFMNLPDAEYPPEVLARLNRIREKVDAQIAKGEKLETLEEYAARRGIALDG